MAAVTLQGRETVYQETVQVEGGGNFDLAVNFLHQPRWLNPEPFLVKSISDPNREFGLVFKQMVNTGNPFWGRSNWECQGFIMGKEFSRKVKEQTIYSRFELEYNSHTRHGVLRILAHEQPPPIIEVIEWHQMVERVNKRPGHVLEVKCHTHGLLRRGIIQGADFFNDRFQIRCGSFFQLDSVVDLVPQWKELKHLDVLQFMIPHKDLDASKPMAYKDGRILFEGNDVVCTVYPQTTISWSMPTTDAVAVAVVAT